MKYRGGIASVLFLVAGCGDNSDMTTSSSATSPTTISATGGPSTAATDDSGTDGPTTGATSSSPTSTTMAAEGAPVFLSFSTNVGKITEGESVTFTALLTDPDGLDDLVGGSLLSESEAIDYGPLVAAGQPGSYSISLSWAQIHQSDPIAFENAEPPRVFRARFFDQKGNKAVKDAEILLTCVGGSACAGTCTDLGLDGTNCGTCGHACASMGCEQGGCTPVWSECFAAADGFNTCSEICKSVGETCANAQCSGSTTKYYNDMIDCMKSSGGLAGAEPCDKNQNWVSPAIKCCCTDSN